MTQELKVPFTLKDSGESDKQIEGYLIITSRGIEITLEGYSTAVEADEGGTPIYIDYYDGVPKIYVWQDINKEDPTTLSLERAAVNLRQQFPEE